MKHELLPSEIIRRRLAEQQGPAEIRLFHGDVCRIWQTDDGKSFTSDKLHGVVYGYTVFDVVVQLLLHSPDGRARKGNARNKEDKVGFGKCTLDTVVGIVAREYFGKALGESTFDPVFVLAAVLEWADIAENCRGYLQLKETYRRLLAE